MIGTTYSSKLKCAFNGWRVISDGEIALDMPSGALCSMYVAIEVAENIMPSVFRIVTFCGEKPDVEYRLFSGKWTAFM